MNDVQGVCKWKGEYSSAKTVLDLYSVAEIESPALYISGHAVASGLDCYVRDGRGWDVHAFRIKSFTGLIAQVKEIMRHELLLVRREHILSLSRQEA